MKYRHALRRFLKYHFNLCDKTVASMKSFFRKYFSIVLDFEIGDTMPLWELKIS